MNPEEMPLPHFRETDRETQRKLAGVDHQTKKVLAPAEYPARHMLAAYYACVELIDHEVGRLLDALEGTGQRENTIVVFMTDHGEMAGDHGLEAKGCRFYEGAVRVPLLISWPRAFRAGLRSGALVEYTDLAPTLLEAAGLPVPGHVQGRSLASLARGQTNPEAHREFVRTEYHDALDLPHHSHADMLRSDEWKLVIYHGQEYGELYHLKSDPWEFENLWDTPQARREQAVLTKTLFDACMLATDPGQPRVGRY
jgi:arylsulfatase A-like enzyme